MVHNRNHRRPWDRLVAAGPPANPLPFDPAAMRPGRRETLVVFDPETREHITAENCLFLRSADVGRVRRAYWPIPHRQPMKTIMGHVEFCYVVTRDDDGDSDDDSGYSDDSDDDDDIVFTLTRQMVAVKVNYGDRVAELRNRHAEDPIKELACMQLVGNDHPHVIGVIDALYVGKDLNVVMPYARNGDLFEMLQHAEHTGSRWTEEKAAFYFRQLMEGVAHLHASGICHRDLSPENVMIDDRNCLIIDMGMAIRIPYTDPNDGVGVTDIQNGAEKRLILPQGAAGKLPYMSPEIYESRRAFDGGAADVWTLGTILFCMVTGNRSYSRPERTDAQFYWMSHALGRMLRDWNIHLSDDLVDLMSSMIEIDPRKRSTLEEVRNHPWVVGAAAMDDAMDAERGTRPFIV